jgi:hypothetical protein
VDVVRLLIVLQGPTDAVSPRRDDGLIGDFDIENLIRNDIDDFFFEELRGRRGVMLGAPRRLDGAGPPRTDKK